MSVHSLRTNVLDLATALRMSRMVTPPRSPLLDAIDTAIKGCRAERNLASSVERFNDCAEAIDKLFEARALVTGERS